MEKITHNGKVLALKISSMAPGSIPVTSPEEAVQILTLNYPKGSIAASHEHIPHRRETDLLQECFIVIRGKIRVFFFDENAAQIAQTDVSEGEVCLSLGGPHGLEYLEDSEIIEVKNGPFFDDKRFITSKV